MTRAHPYQFVTTWHVAAPIDAVWEALVDSAAYPRWWKAVVSVTAVERGLPDGTGRVDTFVWKAPLGYRLRFTMRITTIERPSRLAGVATGELEGTGDWNLRTSGDVTVVRYEWNVRTNRTWMNVLAPVARPVFRRSHDAVMRAGADGLAALLQTTVSAP